MEPPSEMEPTPGDDLTSDLPRWRMMLEEVADWIQSIVWFVAEWF